MVWLYKIVLCLSMCIAQKLCTQEIDIPNIDTVHEPDMQESPKEFQLPELNNPSSTIQDQNLKELHSTVDEQPVEDKMPQVVPTRVISPVEGPVHQQMQAQTQVPKMAVPVISKAGTMQQGNQQSILNNSSQAGLDTINIDSGGNWLEKRIWYEKSEQLFEEIRVQVQKVTDLRMEFVRTVNQAGHQIDDFYQSIDFQKGQIDEILTAVAQSIVHEQEVRGGDLSSSERSLKFKVHADKKSFEALSQQMKMIEDLDEQIDKTMMKAFKEIDTCRGFETRAWNNFKEIGLELDDQKARVLYYEMENFFKNIEQKLNYLKHNLLPYLQQQLIVKVTQVMSDVKNMVQTFEQKGMHIKKLLELDDQGDLAFIKEREKLEQDQAVQEALKAQKKKQKEHDKYGGFFGALYTWLMIFLEKIQDAFCVVFCCVQCLFCKFQAWICALLGY